MNLENCWKKEKNYFFPLPPFLDSRPAPPASPAHSPLPLLLISGRGPAQRRPPASPLPPSFLGRPKSRVPLETAAPPFPPSAADRPGPHVSAAPFLPQPQLSVKPQRNRACSTRVVGAPPSPRPGLFLSEAEPPRVPLLLPAPFFALAHASEAATAEERWDPPCASRRPRAISDLVFPVVRIPLLPSLSPTFYLGIWWLVWLFRVRPGSSCSPAMATAASDLSSGRLLGMAEVA